MTSAGAPPTTRQVTGVRSQVPFVVSTVRVALAVAVANVCVGALALGSREVVILLSAAGFLLVVAQAVAIHQAMSCTQVVGDSGALGESLLRLWTAPWRSVVPAVTAYALAAFVPPLPAQVGVVPATAVALLAVLSLLVDVGISAWTFGLARTLFPTDGLRHLAPRVGRTVRSLQWADAAAMIVLAAAEGALVALHPPRPTPLAVAGAASTFLVVTAGAAVALLRARAVVDDVLDTDAWRRLGAATITVAVAAGAAAVVDVLALAEPVALPVVATTRAGVAGVALGITVTTCLTRGVVHRGYHRATT